MSLDKAIQHGKERREPYRGGKAIDVSCRNHGGGHRYACKWCENARLVHERKLAALVKINEAEAKPEPQA